MSRVVVLIPARFASSRFPGKPLAQILGKSMIRRVYENCAEAGFTTAVVTDNIEIEEHVKSFGGKVVRVDDDVPSGSERIALAYERFFSSKDTELVINVQGDEPLLKGQTIKQLADFHLSKDFDVTTLVRERGCKEEDFQNPNVVKAVWCVDSGRCLYFSRQSLPFDRDKNGSFNWHQHIGVYGYSPKALLKFVKLPLSRLENLEKLEQLRGLEDGLTMGAILTQEKLIGVDVPDDIKKVEGALK